MKKLLSVLLMLVLLTASGARQEPAEENVPPAETVREDTPSEPVTGLTMELEHQVYDPSLTRYTYFIRNDSEKTVEFGEDYALQRQAGDDWKDLGRKRGIYRHWI